MRRRLHKLPLKLNRDEAIYALHEPWHAKRQGKTMNEIKSAFETSIKKAVIYARFSTDLQNERSIEDQITLCRDYASRQGINIIEVYEDKARSGGSIMGRDGLLRLLDQAKDRAFEVVVVGLSIVEAR